jgi:hypothetical protein
MVLPDQHVWGGEEKRSFFLAGSFSDQKTHGKQSGVCAFDHTYIKFRINIMVSYSSIKVDIFSIWLRFQH